MTDITAKPFDWNDNLSEEALEDFEGIQKDLPYCTCQNIGMALAKLELLEKQGCKVIEPSGSSSEKSNKYEDAISRQAVLKIIDGWYDNNRDTENIEDLIVLITYMCSVNPQKLQSEWQKDHEILKAYSDGASAVLESLIEQYEHYLELLDADMKDGSATIVTKTKYAVYTEVVKQLKEVLESEVQE